MATKFTDLYQKIVKSSKTNLFPPAMAALDKLERGWDDEDKVEGLGKSVRMALEKHVGAVQKRLASSEKPEEQEQLSNLIERLELLSKRVKKDVKEQVTGVKAKTGPKPPKAPPLPGTKKPGPDQGDGESKKVAKSKFLEGYKAICKKSDYTLKPSVVKALDGVDGAKTAEDLAKVAEGAVKAFDAFLKDLTAEVKKESDKERKLELSKMGFDLRKLFQEMKKHVEAQKD